MPWRLVVVLAAFGAAGGTIFGFVRGLDYPPTLVFAVVEGAILFGVPACLLGLIAAGCLTLVVNLRRRGL